MKKRGSARQYWLAMSHVVVAATGRHHGFEMSCLKKRATDYCRASDLYAEEKGRR